MHTHTHVQTHTHSFITASTITATTKQAPSCSTLQLQPSFLPPAPPPSYSKASTLWITTQYACLLMAISFHQLKQLFLSLHTASSPTVNTRDLPLPPPPLSTNRPHQKTTRTTSADGNIRGHYEMAPRQTPPAQSHTRPTQRRECRLASV